jgi:hypothetical protein
MVDAKCAEVAAHVNDPNIRKIGQAPDPRSSPFDRVDWWTAGDSNPGVMVANSESDDIKE